MTRTRILGVLACLLCAAAVVLAEQGVVTTNQGGTHEGDITVKGDVVEIMTKGNILVKVNKANVANIEYAGSVQKQFDQRMAKLKDDDSAGRVELARWASEKREYSLALDALDAAVGIDPNNEEALSLRRTILKTQEMQRKSNNAKRDNPAKGRPAGKGSGADDASGGEAATEGGDGEAGAAAASDGGGNDGGSNDDADGGEAARPARGAKGGQGNGKARPQPVKTRLVTPKEINRIRQLEWQKGERATVRFENDVKRKYVNSSEFSPQEFNKLTPAQQGYEILSNGSRRLHADVIIATDPQALAQFKTSVLKIVLPGCATAACHGGTQAGAFVLRNPALKDPEVYTNFLLLQQFKGGARPAKGKQANGAKADADDDDDDEEGGGGGRTYSMVDRTRPDASLLALYGLPDSDNPHPKAANFKPIFKGRNDPRYKQVIDWMGQTLAPIAPEYGIDLTKPPKDDDSTTRPARGRQQGAEEGDGDGGEEMDADTPRGNRGGRNGSRDRDE